MPRPSILRRLLDLALAVPRVVLRLWAMVAVTLVCYVALVGGRWLRRGGGPSGDAARDAWGNRVFRAWSRGLGRCLGWRLEVEGAPPRPPFLLVSNHVSYVDILLLGAAAGGTFVAKSEISGWPVMGHLARAVGTVFIDRGAKRDLVRVSEAMHDALAAGKGVVVFPEGTTSDGRGLLPFKTSLLEVAAADGRAVPWAVVRYSTDGASPPAHRAVAWTGGQPLLPHALRLLAMPGFRARVVFADRPVRGADRKELAARLRTEMAARLGD